MARPKKVKAPEPPKPVAPEPVPAQSSLMALLKAASFRIGALK